MYIYTTFSLIAKFAKNTYILRSLLLCWSSPFLSLNVQVCIINHQSQKAMKLTFFRLARKYLSRSPYSTNSVIMHRGSWMVTAPSMLTTWGLFPSAIFFMSSISLMKSLLSLPVASPNKEKNKKKTALEINYGMSGRLYSEIQQKLRSDFPS